MSLLLPCYMFSTVISACTHLNMKIERGAPRLVKPHDASAAGSPRRVLLSSPDLVAPLVHVDVVYAFRDTPAAAAEALEEALRKVLVEYREWAGRLVDAARPAIELGDEGAVFVEAVADGALQDVFPFDFSPLLLDMVPFNRGAPELLLVQVTRYKCGGLTLGVAWHHRVADGEAAIAFMEAWAAACKGLPIPLALHDRGALMPHDPPRPVFRHDEYRKPPPPEDATAPLGKLVRRKLHFDPATLQRLKASARGFTTFESLTAHLWRCVTSARGLSGNVETRSLVVVNGRRRLRPALPKNYFGNATFLANPSATVQGLLEAPLSHAAGLLHGAITRIDDEYLRSAIDFVECERTNPSAAKSMLTALSPNLRVTTWVHLPLYNLDFGWGTPVFAGPPFLPFEGLVVLTPSYTQDGSIDVLVALFADEMAELERICFDIPVIDEQHSQTQ